MFVSDDLVRYQAPMNPTGKGKKKTGSKLSVAPTAKYLVDHASNALSNYRPLVT